MDPAPPIRRPWLLVAAAVALAVTLGWVLLGGYLPSRERLAALEAELKDVYQKEADLQTQLAQSLQKNQLLQQRLTALASERDGLARRVQELEQELTALKKRPARKR